MEMQGLGRYVRQRRAEAKVSQTELGLAVGKDQPWVSDLERGAVGSLPDPEMLRIMARLLFCDVEDLLRAAGYLNPQPAQRRFTEGDLRLRLHELSREFRAMQRRTEEVARMMDEASRYDVQVVES